MRSDTLAGSTSKPELSSKLHEGVELLRSTINKLETTRIEPAHQLEITDRLGRIMIQQLGPAYRNRYPKNSLSQSRDPESLVDSLIDLHREIARQYRITFRLLAGDTPLDEDAIAPRLKAAYGALVHHKQALLIAYENYRMEPEGIWREIHNTYQQIRTSDLEYIRVPGTADLTIEKVYKHTVLLGLSNPFHLPFRAINKIDKTLSVWLKKATLSDRLTSVRNRCVFLIDALLDAPAIPLLSDTGIPRFREYLFLETFNLALDLRRRLGSLADDTSQHSGISIEQLAKLEEVKTLRLLVKRWGSHKIRSSKRTAHHARCDLAIGTLSVTHAIRTVADNVRREPTDIVLSEDIEQTGFSQRMARHRNVFQVSGDWQIRDSGDHGFRLTFASSQESRIQVNELVAVKPRDGSQDWLTGFVQWARIDGNRVLEIGVRTLSPDARPVSIHSYTTWKGAKGVSFLALLLPATTASPESIIIPATELYDADIDVVGCSDNGAWTIRLKRMISAEPSFYWYEIESRVRDGGNLAPVSDYASARRAKDGAAGSL